MPKPYDRTSYDGKTVDWLTRAALAETAGRLGYDLTLTQGSYNAGRVSASAGTHDGGGVVDLVAYDHARKVKALRQVGFAAWYRPAITGLWPAHIHAVLIGNARLAPSARSQVDAYLAGRNGLADNGPDNGPRGYTDHRFTWRRGGRRITRARALIGRTLARLDTDQIRGYPGIRAARKRLRAARGALPRVQ